MGIDRERLALTTIGRDLDSLAGSDARAEIHDSTEVTDYSEISVEYRTNLSDTMGVKGSEFLRKVTDLGKAKDLKVTFVPHRGKGSHGTLYYGARFTVVRNPKDELKKGTLHAMLKQLGIDPKEF